MITNFKIFEKINLIENFRKNSVNKFIIDNNNNKYTIALCVDVRTTLEDDKSGFIEKIFVEFDCIDIDTNKPKNDFRFGMYGNHEKLTLDEFKKFTLSFLTPEEFYDKYRNICIFFYENVKNEINKLDKESDQGWFPRMLRNFKIALETIPEFEHFASAEKYNL